MITELQLPSDRFFNTTYRGLKQKNFIYGKNGTGKSTITQTIFDSFHATHDVRIFQGFDSVAENSVLNAISLGKENASIQPQIDQISLEISELEKDIIANESKPDNLYARCQAKEKEYEEQDKSIKDNCRTSASKLKREHTDLTGVNYDIRDFKKDIKSIDKSVTSVSLSNTEIEQLQQLINQEEIKNESKQSFPNIDVSGFLEATNEIITTELAKSIILDFSTIEEQNWVRQGMNYHNKGDVCAFCNNPISDQRLDQLNHFFSDNVKKFETRLLNAIERLKNQRDEIDKTKSINPSNFYPEYHNLSEYRQLFILTHNIHFYLNVRYDWWRRAPSTKLTLHLKKINGKSKIDPIETQNKDLKTSYDALWAELRWLYQQDKPNFMLNPIRRIFETFAKFNNISPDILFESDVEAKKLFNVNSHSIDDLEAELNGKTNEDIISKVSAIFRSNNAQSHFEKYWS